MNDINTNENEKQGGGQQSPTAQGPTGSPSAPGATPGKIMSLPVAEIKLHELLAMRAQTNDRTVGIYVDTHIVKEDRKD